MFTFSILHNDSPFPFMSRFKEYALNIKAQSNQIKKG